MNLHGALLINKVPKITSFGTIEQLKKLTKQPPPKLGHGGTLDPFASGLLIILVGKAVKLARYFLSSNKSYEGILRFGETTPSGDPTLPISETSHILPQDLNQLNELAKQFKSADYLQTPPMFSAKKHKGTPLYKLARQGIEIKRNPVLCKIYEFVFTDYSPPDAKFFLKCSSGTYIRTLAQDLAKKINSVGMLSSLTRTSSGSFDLKQSQTIQEIERAISPNNEDWSLLPCWVPFDSLLKDYCGAEISHQESAALKNGQKGALFNIITRLKNPNENCIILYHSQRLIAVARQNEKGWKIEKVFK